jgi:hypothetical protein
MQVLFQIIENVFETGNIFRGRFAKSLVGLQHGSGLLLLLLRGGGSAGFTRKLIAFRRDGAIGVDVEQLIKTEPGEQLAAAGSTVDNVQMALVPMKVESIMAQLARSMTNSR